MVADSKLKELRQKVGVGQVELAERVGCSQALVSLIEAGSRKASPDTLEAIATVLGCSVEEITGEPPLFIQLMRNCKRLSLPQLEALNVVALQFTKRNSPAKADESAGTTNNIASMPCQRIRDCSQPQDKYCLSGARPCAV